MQFSVILFAAHCERIHTGNDAERQAMGSRCVQGLSVNNIEIL